MSEPVELNEIGMKYMFLNLFAHDPYHDYHSMTRVDNSTRGMLTQLSNLLNKTPIKGGLGKRKLSDNESDVMIISENNTSLIQYKEQIVDDFVDSLTNEIFGDGLLYAIDLLNNDDTNHNYDSISFSSLQNNLIDPAIQMLEQSEWSSLSVVHNIYAPELLPILKQASITTDIVSKINEVEDKVKQNLYAIVLSEQSTDSSDSEYTCKSFWDLPDAINKINSYIENNNSISGNTIITQLSDNILTLSNDEMFSQLRRIKNQIIRPMHPDKDHSIGANERFIRTKTLIELIIDTCFTQEYVKNIQIEKKRKLGGSSQTQQKDQKKLMTNVLIRLIKYFLRYTNTLKKTNEPSFINSDSYIPNLEEIKENDDTKTICMKLILNCEILILWITYKSIFNEDITKTELLTDLENNFQKFYSQTIDNYFGILSNFEWLIPNDIDRSSLNVIRHIVEEYYPESNVTSGDILNLKKYVKKTSNDPFIVNNSAQGLKEEGLEQYIYCPLVSILDGMGQCKYTEDMDSLQYSINNRHDIITNLHLNLRQTPESDFYYDIQFIPDTKTDSGKVKLSAFFGKHDDKVTFKSDLLNMYDSNMNTRLETKRSLRAIVNKMLNIYTEASVASIKLRSDINTQQIRFNNLFQTVKHKIIGLSIVKGIGDWGQEIHVLTKNGGIETDELRKSLIRNIHNHPDDLRMGVTGDQVSAARMIFMRLFADGINTDTIVGYQGINKKKNILISDKSFIDVLNGTQNINTHHSIDNSISPQPKQTSDDTTSTQSAAKIPTPSVKKENERNNQERKSQKIKRKTENSEHKKTQRNISEDEQERKAAERERKKYWDRQYRTEKAEQNKNDKNVINKKTAYDMDIDGGKSTKKKRRNHKRNTKRANKRK
jgi:hypothetical protein